MTLLQRLQALTGPDRDADHAVAQAVLDAGGSIQLFGADEREPPVTVFRYPDGSVGTALRYTSSLDAALTLVPENNSWQVTNGNDGRFHSFVDKVPYQDGATPAIALTIAALKARGVE